MYVSCVIMGLSGKMGLSRQTSRHVRHLAVIAIMAATLSGCTNDTLESVNIETVSNKVEHPLSDKVVARMRAMGIEKNAPVVIRIFKEEGVLEIWKANTANRFQMVKDYKICAWSGKLGPKVKEGDRQAPEGFYPLFPRQLNPNSSYFLAINTGFPNTYDQANRRTGSHLMIHGACSSSGCYSMTDEQILEIFAFARDAFKGGQENIQLQAFPFRMTAENMARHRDNPHMDFWKMLKVGYDHFEVTKRPPEVKVCDKRYVFNAELPEGSKMSATAACPALTTPPALDMAIRTYNKSYEVAYQKAMRKYDGMVWYEPSEAERKAIVADTRKGRELAYAPTGSSLDAGKLLKAKELEKMMAEKAAREEAKKTAEIMKAALEKATKDGKTVPVPVTSPIARPAETAAVETTKKTGRFWGLFSSKEEAVEEPQTQPATTLASTPVPGSTTTATPATTAAATTATQSATPAAAATTTTAAAGTVPVPETNPEATVAEAPPKKKPFWKLWGN